MKKIKIIQDIRASQVEYEVNEFITEHDVIDIRYGVAATGHYLYFSAMIVYEED